MKRHLINIFAMILLIISVVFTLTGCSGQVAKEVNNQEFDTQEVIDTNKFGIMDSYEYNFHGDCVYYVYDKETTVEYIIVVYAAGYKGGISITPRYNADGTLKIHE